MFSQIIKCSLKYGSEEKGSSLCKCSILLEFFYVKKTREVAFWTFIRRWNHKPLRFFDIIKPRRMEHLQSEEPFSSDPYFSVPNKSGATLFYFKKKIRHNGKKINHLENWKRTQNRKINTWYSWWILPELKNIWLVSFPFQLANFPIYAQK